MVKIIIKGDMGDVEIVVSNLTQEQLNASEELSTEVNESLLSGVNSNNLENGEEVEWIFAKE